MSGVLLLTLEAMRLLYVVAEGFNDEEGLNTMSDVIAAGVRILATVSCVQSTESFITVTPPKTQSMSYLLPRYHGNFVLVYWNCNGVPATPGSLLEFTGVRKSLSHTHTIQIDTRTFTHTHTDRHPDINTHTDVHSIPIKII